jgi:hypothetical protein
LKPAADPETEDEQSRRGGRAGQRAGPQRLPPRTAMALAGADLSLDCADDAPAGRFVEGGWARQRAQRATALRHLVAAAFADGHVFFYLPGLDRLGSVEHIGTEQIL